MHFVIIGAGGIGCYYGARLQQAGHRVSFIARGAHLRAMQQQGLSIDHPDFHFQQTVQAYSVDQLTESLPVNNVDLVIFTIKGTQTDSMLQQLSGWLKPHDHTAPPLLSLQNGVDNELLIAKLIGPSRTLGGLAVRIGGHVIKPGTIEATGAAQVIMGRWPANNHASKANGPCDHYAKIFNQAGIPTTVSNNIQHELWKKLLINNGVNPLSALTGLDTRSLTRHPVYADTVYRLMQEAVAVAWTDGIEISQQELDEMYRLICDFDAIRTSMLVDKDKGRPLETDAICGAILRRSAENRIATPLTALINTLLAEAPHSEPLDNLKTVN